MKVPLYFGKLFLQLLFQRVDLPDSDRHRDVGVHFDLCRQHDRRTELQGERVKQLGNRFIAINGLLDCSHDVRVG
ncbi:MAG: hypothetical protein ACI9DC_000671 [Gammaproteobacteria bacterium]|jgi:hypothetical protein